MGGRIVYQFYFLHCRRRDTSQVVYQRFSAQIGCLSIHQYVDASLSVQQNIAVALNLHAWHLSQCVVQIALCTRDGSREVVDRFPGLHLYRYFLCSNGDAGQCIGIFLHKNPTQFGGFCVGDTERDIASFVPYG